MKIIGFGQLRNELENDNLENWFKCMLPICDYIYIFDQHSTDGSLEYYSEFDNVVVMTSKNNKFKEELFCKKRLLDKIKAEHPDTTFIQWLDGDELLDGRLLQEGGKVFRKLCSELLKDNCNGYRYGNKNLWRSDIYERRDTEYDWMDDEGRCKLWKFSEDINFEPIVGLHLANYYPININKFKRLDYSLVHRGFATDFQIMKKYDIYKKLGEKGYKLERILDESELDLRVIPNELLPDWFKVTDSVDPRTKERIIDIYNRTHHE